MSARWVVFDLFGTLVPQFPRGAHDRVLQECSELVGIDGARCLTAWRDLYDRRVTGQVSGITGHFLEVARDHRLVLDAGRLERAVIHYRRFVPQLVTPLPGAIEVLTSLRAGGADLALLSNALDDVADFFPESELGPYFNVAVFSCKIGHRKPDQQAFSALLEAIGSDGSERITFVGDGSDDELAGAAAAGLQPVLVMSDLSDSYDPERPGISTWRGLVIDELADLPALLGR